MYKIFGDLFGSFMPRKVKSHCSICTQLASEVYHSLAVLCDIYVELKAISIDAFDSINVMGFDRTSAA